MRDDEPSKPKQPGNKPKEQSDNPNKPNDDEENSRDEPGLEQNQDQVEGSEDGDESSGSELTRRSKTSHLDPSCSPSCEIATTCAGQTCEPAACGAAFVRSLQVEEENFIKKAHSINGEMQD